MIQILKGAKTILYFSWFDYITAKHLKIFSTMGITPVIIPFNSIHEWNPLDYNPCETLLIAQTSSLIVNRFFASKVLSPYTKILFQDGMRLYPPLKRGLKFHFSLLLDKLASRIFYRLNHVYYKNMYAYFFLTTQAAVDEATISYHIPESRVFLYKEPKQYKPFVPLQTDGGITIVMIDQPIEGVFNLSEKQTRELYDDIYSNLLHITNADNIFLKHHPSEYYKKEWRSSFLNATDHMDWQPESTIFFTFYSTLGFEILQEGYRVFFINYQSIFQENFLFVLQQNNFHHELSKINLLSIDFFEQSRQKFLEVFV